MRLLFATLILLSSVCAAQGFTSSTPTPSPFEQAGNAPQFLPVEDAYKLAVEVESGEQLRLFWQIEDSYYLYQHRFDFELLSERGEVTATADLPEALERTDEYFGDVRVYYRDADVTLRLGEPQTGTATLKVRSQGCADAGLCYPPQTEYYTVDFSNGEVSPTTAPPKARSAADAAAPIPIADLGTLAYMLALAFFGGSILNLMPCVFPVLSLKMLSFARSGDDSHHTHSWVYTAGVISSFVLVAAVLIFLQRAGEAVGWGFHLQSPGFVIALAYLFFAMALSLSGVIELGSSVMGAGSGLADKGGLSGSFFTGVLAVVVASPCTAPFMGTALGFAVTQPAPIALGVFAALGAGMAAPMLLLSYSAYARARMPKPGPWMETLKEFLAFPLYATAIWLLWVAGRQAGVNSMALALLGALLIGLGLWLWRYQGWPKAVAVACLVAAASVASWRDMDSSNAGLSSPGYGKIAWSENTLAELRASGRPVFVDVTADWCISCIANEQAVLLTDDISEAFEGAGISYLVADWTNYDADIAAYLKRYGRNGIPFYILYPGDPEQEPVILPQLLTKSIVRNAIAQVSATKPAVTGNSEQYPALALGHD